MNYSYNNFNNPYARNYPMPNYNQPQYIQQPQPTAIPQPTIPQQQMQQPMQQAMPIDTPIQYVGYATLKEAEAYILMPNAKGLFIDKNNGMIYEKVCGVDGQSFISHYKKVELNENKNIAEENAVNIAEFATKTDLKGFVTIEQYKELKEMFHGLQGQITAQKQTSKSKTEKTTSKESE